MTTGTLALALVVLLGLALITLGGWLVRRADQFTDWSRARKARNRRLDRDDQIRGFRVEGFVAMIAGAGLILSSVAASAR